MAHTSPIPLISCRSLAKSFGSKELFSSLSFTLFAHSKIGLVGTNGVGKTTLLRCLVKDESLDEGEIIFQKGLHLAYVPQHPTKRDTTVWDEISSVAHHYHERLRKDPDTWTAIVLSKFGFIENTNQAPTKILSELSGGWQKRVDIAKAYASCPDFILFDEPTNHLDVESIMWLEDFLRKEVDQYLVVSHDRSFLDAVSEAIIEINPCFEKGHLFVEGSYSYYVRRREELVEVMRQRSRGLASKVRSESDWLARGPKARTTKAEARVKTALGNIEDLKNLQTRLQQTQLDIRFQEREIETRRLVSLKNISYSLDSKVSFPLFTNIEFIISPKMRLGIVGPNGCGKTTLLKVIAGQITPTNGTVKYAPGVKITYFDQTRRMIPDTWTVGYALGHGREFVEFAGTSIHIRGWAKRFLFDPDRLDLMVSKLSGGERARLSIARLITEPADILLLDEPTNDLDIETLQVLEECLKEFQGATILVCHDRTFLKNVATDLLAVGLTTQKENVFFSDIDQWQNAVQQLSSSSKKERLIQESIVKSDKESASFEHPTFQKKSVSSSFQKKQKLSFKEEKELQTISEKIEEIEKNIRLLTIEMQSRIAHNTGANVADICSTIAEQEQHLSHIWQRWEELESKKS